MSTITRERQKQITFDILGYSCIRCCSEEYLEIDHINPTAKNRRYRAGSIWLLPRKEFEIELTKCQVLCHNCHANKTLYERLERLKVQHNYSRYTNWGCRCEICCEAARVYYKERYKTKIAGRRGVQDGR